MCYCQQPVRSDTNLWTIPPIIQRGRHALLESSFPNEGSFVPPDRSLSVRLVESLQPNALPLFHIEHGIAVDSVVFGIQACKVEFEIVEFYLFRLAVGGYK